MILVKNPSPHGREREDSDTIDMIVIHAMGEYVGARQMHAERFLMAHCLSAHYLVTPSGVVVQCRDPATQVAWHAGYEHNGRSIGIEVLAPGYYPDARALFERINAAPYVTAPQYMALVALVRDLMGFFPDLSRLRRHSDIDDSKQDPGRGFPWKDLLADVSTCRKASEL